MGRFNAPPVYTQIRCSNLTEFFNYQWSQYQAFQSAERFNDIILQCSDGSVSLHQAILIPLSGLLRQLTNYPSTIDVGNTDFPMFLELPDYTVSIAQSLISLLYTGSCTHESSVSYFSLLSMLSSLDINILPKSLAVFPMLPNNEQKQVVQQYSRPLLKTDATKNIGSGEDTRVLDCNEDVNLGLEGIEALPSTEDSCYVEVSETREINQNIDDKTFDKKRGSPDNQYLIGKLCQVCGVHVKGGMFTLRKHMAERHFYKDLSAMLDVGSNECPVCFKTFKQRWNLARHYGIVHRRVDELLSTYQNNNSRTTKNVVKQTNTINDSKSDLGEDEDDVSFISIHHSNIGSYICKLCDGRRKSKFRLLQHYSVTHFRHRLEDQFGRQFVTNNGTCPVCNKIMKNLYCFLIHMGAAHEEVLKFIEDSNESK